MAVVKHSAWMQKSLNNRYNTATVLIAIPVFDELEYVDNILRAVQRYSDDVLVVDDGSTDGTTELLERHSAVSIISHDVNAGYGRSLIHAFEFARENAFDWIITIDCDHQHEPSYIPHFYAEIENDNADIISGSRYLMPANTDLSMVPPERIAINKKITDLLNQRLGFGLTDAFCGFKAYRTSAISKLKLSEDGYGLPLQLWIQAGSMDLRIREIPVPLIYHDPRRNFGGDLEDPRVRLAYYMQIIERELGDNADKVAGKFCCSSEEEHGIHQP